MYNINQIKNTLRDNIGKCINLRVVKGRKRYQIPVCTIEKAYNGIFVVKTVNELTGQDKLVSFSYSDVLTGTVEIRLIKNIEAS